MRKPLSIKVELPITEKSFKSFCEQLQSQNKMFYFEDNASDITDVNGLDLFTEDECTFLDGYLGLAFSSLEDPMLIALSVINPNHESLS